MRSILAEIHTPERAFVRALKPARSLITLKLNATSTAYLTVSEEHPVVPLLTATEGMRAVVWMVDDDGGAVTKRKLLEGAIGELSGEGPFGLVTIPVRDDFDLLSGVLSWQKPAAPPYAQTDGYARYVGPSETRALAAISANATRLGLPWDVAGSAGRGTVGTVQVRMDALSTDQLLAPLTADRLQLTVARDPSTDRWQVAVTEGAEYTRPLTPQSGVIGSWKWAKSQPRLTRVLVGGAGSDVDREFAVVVDSALEAALGVVLEGFVDAHAAEASEDLEPYGLEALRAARGSVTLTAKLRETTWFRFPAYDVGTKVAVQVGSVEVDDVVTQIDITHDVPSGFTVVPTVGMTAGSTVGATVAAAVRSDPYERLVGLVSDVTSSVRKLERR